MTKTQRNLIKAIKKSLRPVDWLLLALWTFSLVRMNYSQLSTFNKFSLVIFVLWFSGQIFEIYKNYRNVGGRR